MEKTKTEQESFFKKNLEEDLAKEEAELTAKTRMIDDVYGQIDQICEGQAQLEERMAGVQVENGKLKDSLSEMELLQHQTLAGKASAEAKGCEFEAEILKVRQELEKLSSLDNLVSSHHELEQRQKKAQSDIEDYYESKRTEL